MKYAGQETMFGRRRRQKTREEVDRVRTSPCPVCGSRSLTVGATNPDQPQYFVICMSCGANATRHTPNVAYEAMESPPKPARPLPGEICGWCKMKGTVLDITAPEDVGTVHLCVVCGYKHHDYTPETLPAPPIGRKVVIRGIEFDRSEVLEALAGSGDEGTVWIHDKGWLEKANRRAEEAPLDLEYIMSEEAKLISRAYVEWLRHMREIDPMNLKDPRTLHQSKKVIDLRGLRQATCSRSGSKDQDQKGTGPE